MANTAIKQADEQFGKILKWLEDTGRAADTDILVASDHGYSTISEVIGIETLVREAGFPTCDQPGGVAVAPNGGSVLFYTHHSNAETAERLASWLMKQDWCSAITASNAVGAIQGTLSASLIGNEGERVPELAMSFRWDSRVNEGGHPGYAYSSGGAPGLGQHGSMSKHELRNTLVACGPAFRQGVFSEIPSGNIDIAPTILQILGIPGGENMDGRVLEEALTDANGTRNIKASTRTYDASRSTGGKTYRQQITISSVGGTRYVDEGSATLE
jgi:arylsulfatase A-like enzyme